MKSIYAIASALLLAGGVNLNAATADDFVGEYSSEMTILYMDIFGDPSTDWQIGDLTGHTVTITADGDQLTFKNFFPRENGDVVATFDSETGNLTFLPQTVMTDYTFCGYPTGDWWMDNKLTEDPTTLTFKAADPSKISFNMWSVVKGVDVVVTCYYPTVLTKSAGIENVTINDAASASSVIYDMQGRAINVADSIGDTLNSLPSGIYIVNGKKIRK